MKKLFNKTHEYIKDQLYKRHPLVVPVLTFMLLFFVASFSLVFFNGQTIGASDSKVVKIYSDGQSRTVPTRAVDVADLLKRLDIKLNQNDIVEPELETKILEDNFSVNIYRARPVTIIDKGQSKTVLSAHQQPRTIIEKAGIELYPEDGIDKEQPLLIGEKNVVGDQIVVDRAKETDINLYGNDIKVRTRAKTVGELLKQKGIKLIDGDTVEPSKDTAISAASKIFILRKGKQVVTVEEVIQAPVETTNDPTQALGIEVVSQAGSNGKKIVTYEVEMQNNVEVSRKVLHEVIAVNPVKRIVTKGTKVVLTGGKEDWLIAAGVSPADYAAADYIISRESGWCPTKWQGEYGGCPAYHGTPSTGLGYGLCQSTPGYKMATAGADWATNPVTQLRWCTGYASRYGGWQGAYNFWITNHWW